MKKINNIIFVCLITLSCVFTSCTKDFLEVENINNITTDNFYKDVDDAKLALTSCYDPSKQLWGHTLQWIYYSINGNAYVEKDSWRLLTFTSDESQIGTLWTYLYRGLYRCNLFFEKTKDITDGDLVLLERYTNEALFMRGVYNLYLAINFGEAPYTKDQIVGAGNVKGWSNSEPGELFNAAIKDFKEAQAGLPLKSVYSLDDMGRATKGAAQAMLGKAYLWIEEWDSAAYWLDQVIQSGEYSLVTPLTTDSADLFDAYTSNFTADPYKGYGGENNEESVFEIQFAYFGNHWHNLLPGYGSDGSMVSQYFGYTAGSFKNLSARYEAVDVFEAGQGGMNYDVRRAATILEPGDTVEFDPTIIANGWGGVVPIYGEPSHNVKGWWELGVRKRFFPGWFEYNSQHDPNNHRLIRYADVLLMFAEADFHLNGANSAEGLAALNEIRARVNMPARTELSIDNIINERLYEFMFELEEHIHLVRWSTLSSTTPWISDMRDYNKYFVIGKHELLPIPLFEIDYQEGVLKQNPGW